MDNCEETAETVNEQRLSPVLNSHRINRKLLLQRKLQRQSSRVKLTDRFQSSSSSNQNSAESVNNTSAERNLNHSNGFQTVSGRIIKLSDVSLEKHSKLFADILNPVENPEKTPKTEIEPNCDFLDLYNEETDKLFENITIIENEIQNKVNFTNLQPDPGEALKPKSKEFCKIPQSDGKIAQFSFNETMGFGGFQTASGKGIKLPESAIDAAQRRFNEDFSNCPQVQAVPEPLKTEYLEDKLRTDHNKETGFVGIKTASSKDVRLSQSSHDNARSKLPETLSKVPQFNDKANFGVFRSASGKGIKLSESAIDAAQRRFKEDFSNCPQVQAVPEPLKTEYLENKLRTDHNKETGFVGIKTALSKDVRLSESSHENARSKLPETLSKVPQFNDKANFGGFRSASGKGIKLSESAIDAAQRRFKEDFSKIPQHQHVVDEDLKSLQPQLKTTETGNNSCFKNAVMTNVGGFQTASGKGLTFSKSAIEAAERRFNDDLSKIPQIQSAIEEDLESMKLQLTTTETHKNSCFKNAKIADHGGFKSAAGTTITLSVTAINAAKKRLYENLENCKDLLNIDPSLESPDDLEFPGFYNEEISKSQQYLRNFNQIAVDIGDNKRKCSFDSLQPTKILKTNESLVQNTHEATKNINISTEIPSAQMNRSRKRLGMSIKSKPVVQEKLARAKLIFDDDLSPIKPNHTNCFNSTPVKTPILSKRETPVLFNSTITPIKSNEKELKIVQDFPKFLIQQQTGGNFDVWASNLEKQRLDLENKLRMIVAKQEALNFQRSLHNNPDSFYKKKRQGVLLSRKQMTTRVSLKGLKIRTTGLEKMPTITPQNAAFIHFRNDSATVKTEDGAMIVPNMNNLIGFIEISNGFKTMPGIEPKLIPQFWLENHFKWIVWKLASYENFFENGQDCLNIENILQQLKYRYDREIDSAERSILRRILEKDDTPQKRMVLCVANIIKLSDGKFELQLTDGWYSIKTVIDEILSIQIVKNKIGIGTKLMINSAELLNCDGCHPLEAPDCVYLKINSNSTRRTLWHCKLGCYHIPEPFPISLRSIQPSGGLVACMKVYIARIYPIRYLEKQSKMRVWRNQRGEERRAQEWENEKLKRIEKVHELVRKDYEKSLANSNKNSSKVIQNKSDILEITCGRTLFQLYENSKDPDSFQELLSDAQRHLMIEFQRDLSFNKQQEINHKIKENINELDICQRDVTAVLKILVVDTIEASDKGYIFQIWKADEHHLQTLKEGSIFRINNVMPKISGDLSSTSKTRFKQEHDNLERFNKFNRMLRPISTLLEPKSIQPNFNEFDTVGVIVQLSINQYDQDFWLSDSNNSCMCFVKIFENPRNCSLLDNLKIGDIIAISNLIYCEKQFDVIRTIANHSTIVSKYPQSKHLIEGIGKLSKELSAKDVEEFLADCKEKVAYHLAKISIVKSGRDVSKSLITDANLIEASETLLEEVEESTLTSKITSIDVAMSMIDLDNFT